MKTWKRQEHMSQTLVLLFREFFFIGLVTIGGGMAMIPVIENVFTKKHNLLKESDITDMIGIAQTVPGLIAINCSVFVGHKLAGWKGSLFAVTGVILPSLIMMTAIAFFFSLEQLSNEHIAKAFNCVIACVLPVVAWFYRFVVLSFETRINRHYNFNFGRYI